jgi:hypothetical protein
VTLRQLLLPVACILLFGCASRAASPAQITAEEAKALDEAANMLLNEMSPEERREFSQKVEGNVVAEMQANAARCGTALEFTNEARFADRTVLINSSATPEQIACVQQQYPFAKRYQ